MILALNLRAIVYSYGNHPTWPWRPEDITDFENRYPGAELVLDNWSLALRIAQKVRSIAAMVGGRIGELALKLRIPGAAPGLDRIRLDPSVSAAIVSYSWGLSHLNGPLGRKVIIDTHDLNSLSQIQEGRRGRLGVRSFFELRREMFYLSLADEVWSISNAEYWLMAQLLGAERVRLVPPAMRAEPASPSPAGEAVRYDLVFVGSNNRWNGRSLADFLRSCKDWDLGLNIGVAGAVCRNEDVREAAAALPGATLLGFVDDLKQFYAGARAAVCPVEGTGTKIKLIEALQAGRPVFAAIGALAGLLPGYEGCVFPIDPISLRSILGDPEALASASQHAVAYADAYSFDRTAEHVREALE